ncbi:MAG: acyl-CoA thioesterase [Acidobacteriota bacterium]
MSTRFSIRLHVRFRDIDALGHVNNSFYFTYMDSARTEYWMKLFALRDLREVKFIVAHAECDYKVAARFGDELEVSIWTSSIGNTSFVWDYEIRQAVSGDLIASGKTIQVYYDYTSGKTLPVPEEVRQKLLS